MLYLIIGLIAITAGGGMVALLSVMKSEKPPRIVVVLHGVFASAAVVLLAIAYLNGNDGLVTSLIIYGLAAVGGYYLLFKDLKSPAIPKGPAIAHALLAVAGTVVLLFTVFA